MGDRYRVELLPGAARQFEKLALAVRHRLQTAISRLQSDPRPPGVKHLSGPDGLLRVRVGDHRIIYRVIDDRLLVLVIRVGHRRDVYRAAARGRLRR
ncbi:MAG TPA: type II toxin-antitoxin system RelE/ParE family toxin [Pleomorphomonadaceae bacterium]|nr:type II toxin-antitoxin system RelE/ParE family toxin [Pleomorphomonadaceae bacterium]